MYTFLLFSRFTVMKYKVLLCLLWELTTPVPVERRLANYSAHTYRLLTVESFVIRYTFLKWIFPT